MPTKTETPRSGAARGIAGRRWTTAAAACGAAALTAFLPRSEAKAAQGLADLSAVAPVMECAAVADLDLTGATDAPVTIQSATVVAAGTPAPYCEVRGTIAPANTIVVRLPTQGWTQRYLQTGCGGLCGTANISYSQAGACPPVADGTIASATTDMGHQGQNDGSWGAGNPQAEIDFAYRGVHATAEAAKALIARFYGRAPAYSYFSGCSDGGREALMEAQRFPSDFDGIAAGAPANDLVVQNTFHHGWGVLANRDASGNPILLAGKLPLVHAAVVAACDGLDGVADGLIDDPRRCSFDPASLLCAQGQDEAACLTEAEAGVVRRLHEGATDAEGRRLEQRIAREWGSELDWTLFVPAAPDQTAMSENFVTSFARYLAFYNADTPDWQLTDLRFTVPYFQKVVETSHYWAATDPDLGSFEGRGGKLLLWHGWSDQHISPQGTLQYYHAMRDAMGTEAVERFALLYLFPGVAHCSGGEGPDSFDILTPVMAWVETGTAPGRIVASKSANGSVARTRPVFPYPTVARYVGSGSIDDAANFAPSTPPAEARVGYRWVGAPLYSPGYESWCGAEGAQLVCEGGQPYPWEATRDGPDWSLSRP